MKNASKNNWQSFILLEGSMSLLVLWLVSVHLLPLFIFLITQSQEQEKKLEAFRFGYELIQANLQKEVNYKRSGGTSYSGKAITGDHLVVGVEVHDEKNEVFIRVATEE